MSDWSPEPLDTCGCCEDTPERERANRLGLPEIAYRLGTYGSFLPQLLAQISRLDLLDGGTLRPLTTRAAADGAIALMDAWAVVADVLTFYQERIANEGFLGTATERRSLLELARAIGYELNPGVAARTYLAFTVEKPPAAAAVTIPAGTQIQSLPADGQLPQTFETEAEFTARVEWNQLLPRQQRPQELTLDSAQLYLAGTPRVQVGDWVAIVVAGGNSRAKRVSTVVPEPERQRTRVQLAAPVTTLQPYLVLNLLGFTDYAVVTAAAASLSAASVNSLVLAQPWRESDLNAFLGIQRWSPLAVATYANQLVTMLPDEEAKLYHFQGRTSPFGHNAPRWDSLPASQRFPAVATEAAVEEGLAITGTVSVPYQIPWDGGSGPPITQNSQGVDYDVGFYCDRNLPEIVPDSLVLLESPSGAVAYQVTAVKEASLADYALSGKVTGVSVQTLNTQSQPDLSSYRLRSTTIHAHSQRLPLAPVDIAEDIGIGTAEAQQLTLDRMVPGLQVGQPVALAGELHDLPGVEQREILFLKEIIHQNGLTTLQFDEPLQQRYRRDTAVLQGNLVAATHGETVAAEVLGSGDGAAANQRFFLKKPPLTYLSAQVPSGGVSTLEVRVDRVLWSEVPGFYGLSATAPAYQVRIADSGAVEVVFGDGRQGARLPTGVENVVARYRSGIGRMGEVPADSLSLLKQRPLGARSVTNPLAASGAEDPETLDTARDNAPRTVRTLDRIVSLTDYEDFARGFSGVGKAQAVALWDGRQEQVRVSASLANGDPITDNKTVLGDLKAAMERYRDPARPLQVAGFATRYFNLAARLWVDERYVKAEVTAQVEAQLQQAFVFAQRGFGQGVSAAEVVEQIHRVAGVVAVDLDDLYRVEDLNNPPAASLSGYLESSPAAWPRGAAAASLAELLLINPAGIRLEVVDD